MNQLPIIERAIAHGDRIAVRSVTGTHTFQSLVAKSERVAAFLLGQDRDLDEKRIAYLVPAGEQYIAVQWGIWRAGGIAIPLSQSATEQEMIYTLTDSQVVAVVVAKECADKMSFCEDHGIRLHQADDLPVSSRIELPEIDLNRRAMILYTSGTTNKPKGVVTTHACIQAQIESLVEAWCWESGDRIPLFLPLHHIHGIINVLSCALWSGGQIEAYPRFEMDVILGRVAEDAYTVFMAVPTIYVKMIQALEGMERESRERIVAGFGRMRLMISGSAALPATIHQRWTELTGQRLLERYGMTEIGMGLSNPYEGERRPGAVGKPLPGVKIRLLAESGESNPGDGIAGEIQVCGENVFQEYWNRPEATENAFVDGWFRTGDIAVVEEGYFRIMGRSSVDIIKSGGYKLSALEIEATLLDHPAIDQVAVVGINDETWGEIVAAAVVLKAGEAIDLDSLRAWSKDRVSAYKVPRQLIVVDELARNAMGKVTKPAVKQLFEASQESK
jgi:malonyl-CoA/methylmalonyl-CoA synthetase